MSGSVNAALCRSCGNAHYPTHYYCPHCGERKFDPVPIEGDGTLLTWTRVYALSPDYTDRYITLGIVDLDMGIRATGRLDIAEPEIGSRVRATVGKVRETDATDIEGLIFAEQSSQSRRSRKRQ